MAATELAPLRVWSWRRELDGLLPPYRPTYLVHDRDSVYGGDFDRQLATLGITGVRTPPRVPTANAIAERIVRTIRTECLDHLIVIDERHLHVVLAEFADYYNATDRTAASG